MFNSSSNNIIIVVVGIIVIIFPAYGLQLLWRDLLGGQEPGSNDLSHSLPRALFAKSGQVANTGLVQLSGRRCSPTPRKMQVQHRKKGWDARVSSFLIKVPQSIT